MGLMPSIKHHKVSAKADGTDSTLVLPSDWNAVHDLKSAGASVWLGRDATGPGDVQEFPVDAGVGDDFTIWTKAQVQAAITAALADVDIPAVGDLCASLAPTKANWVIANGHSIGNVGSGAGFASAAAENLFKLLWGLNANTWPVLPTRGSSADGDWHASAPFKTIALPDARGCVIGMVDLSAGVNALIVKLGVKVGTDKVSLTVPNLPTHDHPLPDPLQIATQQNLGGVGGGSPLWSNTALTPKLRTGKTGGDPAATPANSVPVPVNTTQPTLGANIFIKL
jgi:microcystin-dependent protein